jgi:hypothetical protein
MLCACTVAAFDGAGIVCGQQFALDGVIHSTGLPSKIRRQTSSRTLGLSVTRASIVTPKPSAKFNAVQTPGLCRLPLRYSENWLLLTLHRCANSEKFTPRPRHASEYAVMFAENNGFIFCPLMTFCYCILQQIAR